MLAARASLSQHDSSLNWKNRFKLNLPPRWHTGVAMDLMPGNDMPNTSREPPRTGGAGVDTSRSSAHPSPRLPREGVRSQESSAGHHPECHDSTQPESILAIQAIRVFSIACVFASAPERLMLAARDNLNPSCQSKPRFGMRS
jgi:hypothetical protein